MKVSDLQGAALDAAVARAEGLKTVIESWMTNPPKPAACWLLLPDGRPNFMAGPYSPSVNWFQGGPILERERITIVASSVNGEPVEWSASVGAYTHYIDEQLPFGAYYDGEPRGHGPTPLVAAMRAFVVSRLGDEVDLP